MQAGAAFVTDARDLARLEERNDRDDHSVVWVGSIGQTLDHKAAAVFDMTSRADHFYALYEVEDQTVLLEVDRAPDLEVTMIRTCPRAARRVAVTETHWYVASDAEVYSLAHRTQAFELLAVDPVDIAASRSELCVLDPRGATWFARDGSVVARRLLPSPTAVHYDQLASGWLIVADGDVLQLASPAAEPAVLARGVGLASRVRRDLDALYAFVGGELVEVIGVREGPTTNAPRAIASYAPRWSQFDAYFELHVDEGTGPQRFYHPTKCGCRTRSIEVVDRWTERRSDASFDHFERHRCPLCGQSWDEWFAG